MADFDFDKGGKTIAPVKLAHIVLRTHSSRYEKQVQFYKDFLGAEPALKNDLMCFLAYDDEHHRIGIFSIPDLGDKNPMTCGLEHIAFTFSNLNELLLSYRQRKRLGVEPFWCVNHGPTLSFYYKDLDGNILETQVDIFETPDQANEYIAGKEYKENPIGVDVDPEELIKKKKEGVPDSVLFVRPNIGPRNMFDIPQ